MRHCNAIQIVDFLNNKIQNPTDEYLLYDEYSQFKSDSRLIVSLLPSFKYFSDILVDG